jgi:hypothetical protein
MGVVELRNIGGGNQGRAGFRVYRVKRIETSRYIVEAIYYAREDLSRGYSFEQKFKLF